MIWVLTAGVEHRTCTNRY